MILKQLPLFQQTSVYNYYDYLYFCDCCSYDYYYYCFLKIVITTIMILVLSAHFETQPWCPSHAQVIIGALGQRTSCMIISSWSSLKMKPQPAWSPKKRQRLLSISPTKDVISVVPIVWIYPNFHNRCSYGLYIYMYTYGSLFPVRFLQTEPPVSLSLLPWTPLPQPPAALPRRRRHPPTAPCRRHSSSPAPYGPVDVQRMGLSWLKHVKTRKLRQNAEWIYAGFMWISPKWK